MFARQKRPTLNGSSKNAAPVSGCGRCLQGEDGEPVCRTVRGDASHAPQLSGPADELQRLMAALAPVLGWGDEAEDSNPEEPLEPAPAEFTTGGGRSGGGGSGERPRLKLMPRGATSSAAAASSTAAGAGGSKSNPFGAAKPREEGTKPMPHERDVV